MNTSITRDLFTYKCDKCRQKRDRRVNWGPWLVCCRKEAQQRGIQTKANALVWNDCENMIPTSAAPNPEDVPKDCCNHLGPFGTMQKTTCGAMWTYERCVRENKKEKLGIEPADVLAWGRNTKFDQNTSPTSNHPQTTITHNNAAPRPQYPQNQAYK
ncbi:uncharacterized protein LOC142349513 [Convolutriloba macropyga]|uniref:uncharacterized protein LOC142349513 n=1 Tax=Convolutriloba macropyga TaxID=536237 RepID=UPI003F51BB00